jgi:hypothetical protein
MQSFSECNSPSLCVPRGRASGGASRSRRMPWPIAFAAFLILAPSSIEAKKPVPVPVPQTATIPAGSAIFVNSNNGFDNFILAAIQSKQVKLHLVSSADKADYVLDSDLFHTGEFVATPKYASTGVVSEAAFKLTSKSGEIVWAYAVTKGMFSRGKQSVAEACAKHLSDIVK